ncbi:head-tail joining protein [Pseudoduganella albidiflava]|uniref:PilZ domain-containing protein n=1 Tax=Pseudoduganella albidiflava TaxID=321983 RepID=A0A411X2R0_9BURK|nr:hypothetical protein [Pseudoduganella albidiflava]QBI03291.1 hypothetical protein EYF70_22525 [Pseudoduganella albidiflava]GGY68034.1 hypothetical protein GCM10007387_57770 [Pseudoduganella albidiflava]
MFALLEARTNRVAMTRLANARAQFGDKDVPVIFDAQFKVGMVGVVGMGAAVPQMTIASDQVPEVFVGTEIRVNNVPWIVSDRQPDGEQPYGLTAVFLERP